MQNERVIQIIRPRLTAYQQAILQSIARFTVTTASTKIGKTFSHLWWLFEQAGLREIEASTISASLEHATFEEWWEPYTRGVGPAGAYATALDPEHQAALRERCRALLPPAPFVLTSRAWAARGIV